MKFEAGDHVFIGRGPGGAVKHHAIVVTAEDKDGFMEIVEFGVFDKDGQKKVIAGTGLDSALAGKNFGEVRRSRVQKKSSEGTWQPAREPSHKAGKPSNRSPEEVAKAALFLLENGKTLLPKYHITMANGECFAQWCQTGEFSSGQADKLYGSVNKVQTVAKMLPVAAVVGGKKNSSKVTTSTKASGKASGAAAAATATAAVAGIVTAATAMVEKRHAKVNDEWIKTKEILDAAYASHVGQSA